MSVLQSAEADRYKEALRERAGEKLYRHAVSVAETAVWAARFADVDPFEAMTAGLLHDICKPLKPDQLLERARHYDLPIGDIQRERPVLLHGPIAAEESRERFGIEGDIYDAIYWHTTGKVNFSRLGMTLYFADFAEPFRPYREAEEARKRLEIDGFTAAVLFVAESKLERIRRKTDNSVDPATEAFHQWLIER